MQSFRRERLSRVLRRTMLIAGCVTALALTGCAKRGGPIVYNPPGFGAPDSSDLPVSQQPQVIGALDKIRVTVFQVEELSGEFQVDSAGTLHYPLIGEVSALGKSSSELAVDLADRLHRRHLRSPIVHVAIIEAMEQVITIDGAVRQPGIIPIRSKTSLLQAIASARGTSDDANPRRVAVFRTIGGQRMAAAFDLQEIRRGQAEDPPIYGNDIIVVDGDRTRVLLRDVLGALPVLGLFRPY